jgi:hypothetical protein
MKQFLYGLAAWGLLVGLPGLAKAQYNYTTLEVPGAASTSALGINASGQIVGSYDAGDRMPHSFLLDVDGSYTTLDPPGSIYTQAYGINDLGQSSRSRADGCTPWHRLNTLAEEPEPPRQNASLAKGLLRG